MNGADGSIFLLGIAALPVKTIIFVPFWINQGLFYNIIVAFEKTHR